MKRKKKERKKRSMALLLPSAPLLPLTRSRAAATASSPLSIRRPRPRTLPLPRAHCSARPTPHPAAAGREAAASWAGKLAGAVPWKAAVSGALALAVSFTCFVGLVNARTGVNKPELLPKEFTTVIDVAGFLSSGQENRLRQEIEDLEKDTGFKLRVLAQNYPDTPGELLYYIYGMTLAMLSTISLFSPFTKACNHCMCGQNVLTWTANISYSVLINHVNMFEYVSHTFTKYDFVVFFAKVYYNRSG
uniref:TPM domain-containing protein n=1 Tax=Arundo donax TaxID=35708 RepID=A0A0A9EW83_ARUDO